MVMMIPLLRRCHGAALTTKRISCCNPRARDTPSHRQARCMDPADEAKRGPDRARPAPRRGSSGPPAHVHRQPGAPTPQPAAGAGGCAAHSAHRLASSTPSAKLPTRPSMRAPSSRSSLRHSSHRARSGTAKASTNSPSSRRGAGAALRGSARSMVTCTMTVLVPVRPGSGNSTGDAAHAGSVSTTPT